MSRRAGTCFCLEGFGDHGWKLLTPRDPGVFKQDHVSISKKTKKQKTTGCLGFHIQSSKFSSHPSPKSIASSKTPRLKSQDRVDYKTILWIYNFAEGCSEVETPSEQPKSKPQLGEKAEIWRKWHGVSSI